MGNFLGKLFGFVVEDDQVSDTENNVEEGEISEPRQNVLNEKPNLDYNLNDEVQSDINEADSITAEPEAGQNEDKRTQLTHAIVETALKNDYGSEAILLNFEVKDFTKPGDNYATLVTSVQCEATLNENKFKTSYVVKLNNSWILPGVEEMSAEFFRREGNFLTEVKSCLNKILSSLNEDNLSLPECIYESYEKKKEILIMKDLRERNFKMFDRHVGMNAEHATMVVNGLARVHASGFIYKEQNKETTLLSKFPNLIDSWVDNPVGKDSLLKFFTGLMVNAAALLENRKEYDQAREWLLQHKEEMVDLFMELIYNVDEKFETICHGDIWNNNILFRYNDENRPIEVILLDLQMCRISSVATDLHYFLNASMDGEERSKNLEVMLHSYYTTLEKIVRKAQISVPFSFSELKEEYVNKQMYGLISVLMIVPLVMKSVEETTDFSKISEENMDEMLKEERRKTTAMMENNPLFKSRFLSVFDDCNRLGMFDEVDNK